MTGAPAVLVGRHVIRPMEDGDAEALAALRRRLFRATRRPTDDDLGRYMRAVFTGTPWFDPDLASLVLEIDGEIVGFLGTVPRPIGYRGERLRGVLITQLMVDPAYRDGWPLRLLQEVAASGQDLTLSDAPSRGAVRLWDGRVGRTAAIYRFFWTQPLWRTRIARLSLGGSAASVAARSIARGVARAGEARLDRSSARLDAPATSPLGVGGFTPALAALAAERGLHVAYDAAGFDWMLDRVREKWGAHAVHALVVHEGEDVVGCFVLVVRSDGVAQVMYAVAAPDRAALVMDAARVQARAAGAGFLDGRYDPVLAPVADARSASYRPRGLGVIVAARDPDVLDEVLTGRALLTGLDGEWWLDF